MVSSQVHRTSVQLGTLFILKYHLLGPSYFSPVVEKNFLLVSIGTWSVTGLVTCTQFLVNS